MPAHRSPIRAHTVAYLGLAALFVVSVTAITRDISDSIDQLRHGSEYARPPFYLGDANWGIAVVQPEAEEVGITFGDALLAVNGRPVDGVFVYYSAVRQARAGDRLHAQVQSPGPGNNPIRDLSIELRPYRGNSDPAMSFAEYLDFALRVVAMPVVCIVGFSAKPTKLTPF
jgi:hypothetical protein